MVKITNGKVNYTVAKSVYESIFKKRGFKIIGGADDGLQKQGVKQEGEKGEEVELSEDEKRAAEIEENPISSWTKDDIRFYAKVKEIDISSAKNPGEARNIISRYLNN